MTEQTNPTAGEEETTTQAPAETQESAEERQPAQRPAQRPEARRADYDDDDEYEGDDEYEDEYEDQEEDDDLYVDGPAEYVQRERGGRGRRIGGDVRPEDIDYKNIGLLSRFLDRRGRILSRRKTRVSARVQRRIVTAIKRARHLALLPYTGEHTRIVRKRR
jgi:small subunit ribosomal protein S18